MRHFDCATADWLAKFAGGQSKAKNSFNFINSQLSFAAAKEMCCLDAWPGRPVFAVGCMLFSPPVTVEAHTEWGAASELAIDWLQVYLSLNYLAAFACLSAIPSLLLSTALLLFLLLQLLLLWLCILCLLLYISQLICCYSPLAISALFARSPTFGYSYIHLLSHF